MSPEEWMASKGKKLMSPEEWMASRGKPPAAPEEQAAFGVFPKQRAVPSRPETQEAMRTFEKGAAEALGFSVPKKPEMSAKGIGAAGALGAGAALAGPRLLSTLGAGVQAIPLPATRAVGAGMRGVGTALQAIPTATRTGAGGAIMAGAETAGQLGEQVGVPRAVSETALLGAPAVARTAVRGMLGRPTQTLEQYARAAEDLGFRLSPAQVRADIPVPAKGATLYAERNQRIANELASASTGQMSAARNAEISPEFVRGRLKQLGGEFDQLYRGRDFNIDQPAVDAIRAIAAVESQLPPSASVSAVRTTANTILDNFSRLASRPGAQPGTFAIEGDMLQRLRTDLLGAARSATQRQDAHQLYGLVDVIDQSIARNHPQIAARLAELRPQYRNTVILEDLIRANGIKGGNISLEKLGNMLGARKTGVRSERDLDQLGEMGRELQLRALWETEGRGATAGEDVLGKLLGTGADIAGRVTGMRSAPARAAQRYFAE